MARNYYSEINLHITWHCKESLPLLTRRVERIVFDDVRSRIGREDGAIFREIGGTETHVHVVASIPPTLQISEWIGRLKGGSSYAVNNLMPGGSSFEWQVGYGVVSFATKNVEGVCRYAREQKEIHAKRLLRPTLERITAFEDPP